MGGKKKNQNEKPSLVQIMTRPSPAVNTGLVRPMSRRKDAGPLDWTAPRWTVLPRGDLSLWDCGQQEPSGLRFHFF